jgi:hypothetical protein
MDLGQRGTGSKFGLSFTASVNALEPEESGLFA